MKSRPPRKQRTGKVALLGVRFARAHWGHVPTEPVWLPGAATFPINRTGDAGTGPIPPKSHLESQTTRAAASIYRSRGPGARKPYLCEGRDV